MTGPNTLYSGRGMGGHGRKRPKKRATTRRCGWSRQKTPENRGDHPKAWVVTDGTGLAAGRLLPVRSDGEAVDEAVEEDARGVGGEDR